jgi:hypothetical protein
MTNKISELVTCLLHHRSGCRSLHYRSLWHRLLSILLQAQTPKVHGCSR